VHRYDDQTEELAQAILAYTRHRLRLDPVPLDGPKAPEELERLAGQTITEDGLGGQAALKLFADALAPACISVDHPRFLSFIPAAPTEAAVRRRSTAARGSRAPARCTRRTRRCGSSPT
jgi:L-2,4-diaminobutyrate decarboxylase